ncbi:HYR domain-containing protein [Reichenbachiella versicolor]|uniref:HYR domain-containing protein n=1 Tax=Reichenbachiella versicolor TaxID=1821036 RepID=UPI0013A57891|nr:HYR domain-containing protein [Reichenbachiella versicolor]
MIRSKMMFFIFSFLVMAMSCDESETNNSDGTEEENGVKDEIDPVISCPSNIEHMVKGSEQAFVSFDPPVGTDDNDPVTKLVEGLPSGSTFPDGTTTNVYTVTDKAGNTSSCSFDITVIRDLEGLEEPFVIGGVDTGGKKWERVDALSDEFNGTEFDDSKWWRDPEDDGFKWYGREPTLFRPENVSVGEGNMNVEVFKLEEPESKTIGGNLVSFDYGGCIIRSQATAGPGQFYETRMKANATVLSSTFWIAFQQSCTEGPTRKLELDIQECVGRVHSETETWALKWDNIFHSNTWRHARSCDVDEAQNSPAKTLLEEKNHSRYFVYGCWWKSPSEILFYLDGKLIHQITDPPADFDLSGHITMAIETYDWNPMDDDNNLVINGTLDQRTTKYDWVRTWKLVDE